MIVLVNQQAQDDQRSDGFSSIDLLVVLAIIALLAMELSPVLARTRVNDQSFQCQNNLRQLTGAMLWYTYDNRDFLPPNPDDGNITPYHNWCAGEAGIGGSEEFNSDILKDPTRSLLVPYIAGNAALFRCPSDSRTGKSTAPSTLGQVVPRARDCSMSQAVGTDPSTGGRLPVNGMWLNGGTNTRNGPWLTYGKATSILRPIPARLLVLLDESAFSVNDAAFAVNMVSSLFLDCPGVFHDLGCNIAFADGHVEMKHWTDSRISVWPSGEPYNPPNLDVAWLQERTSVLK